MVTFNKSIFAVELNGKPYAIALPVAALEEVLALAAKRSPDGKLDLRPMPNQDFFELAMTPGPQHEPAKL